jgi:hypothetical protein
LRGGAQVFQTCALHCRPFFADQTQKSFDLNFLCRLVCGIAEQLGHAA